MIKLIDKVNFLSMSRGKSGTEYKYSFMFRLFKRWCKTIMIQILSIDRTLLLYWATFRKTSAQQTQSTWKSITLFLSFLSQYFPSVNHFPWYFPLCVMCLLLLNYKIHPTQNAGTNAGYNASYVEFSKCPPGFMNSEQN